MRTKRRNLLLAGLVAVAVVGGLAWLIVRNHVPPEPVYQGKRLSEWLHEDPGAAEYDPVEAQAVRQIGTNGIPTLLRMLRARDSGLTLKLIGLAEKQHLVKINFVRAELRNWEAVGGFNLLGTSASNAVPALIQIYEENISEISQMATANALSAIGPAATAAVPVLLRTADNTNANAKVRGDAAWALGQLRAEPELVVPALIKCLKDSEPSVRYDAAMGLESFGSDAKAAVPALIDLLKDEEILVREQAEEALKAIDPEAAAKAGVK